MDYGPPTVSMTSYGTSYHNDSIISCIPTPTSSAPSPFLNLVHITIPSEPILSQLSTTDTLLSQILQMTDREETLINHTSSEFSDTVHDISFNFEEFYDISSP